MNLAIRPEIQRYIDDQVKVGRFPSPEALIETAIRQWREIGETELDDVTIAAINEAEEQADRGEGMELKMFETQVNKRYSRL